MFVILRAKGPCEIVNFGILGAAFLNRHKAVIDYGERKQYLLGGAPKPPAE